ncbi:MAG: YlbF family regulator [Clostridia bacterium]
MNVYDTANRLATEIRQSKEYEEYKELKDSINNNTEQKAKVEEFEQLRYKMQLDQMQGINPKEEDKKALENKYAELLSDDQIKKYFEAEMKFNVLIGDVNKIIAEAVKDVI